MTETYAEIMNLLNRLEDLAKGIIVCSLRDEARVLVDKLRFLMADMQEIVFTVKD